MPLEINRRITIPDSELSWEFVRGSGPGGQNVNRVASAVQLKFNVADTNSLPEDVRRRLTRLARNRINQAGELLIEAREHRSQDRNRKRALARLKALVEKAARPPKKRKPTTPSRAAREWRLRRKREQSEKKRRRRFDPRRDLP